jgi:hypothetical protein
MSSWAEVLGTDRRWVWLKLPDVFPHRILTMPRAVLPRGMATALKVAVLVDPDSFRYNGSHYQADLKVIDVLERRPSPGEEGDLDTAE